MTGPADERRHPPGPESTWAESWYFDFVAADGRLGGFVRLALLPAAGVAWYWAYLAGPDRETISVRDHEVRPPRGTSLEIRAEGLWADLYCETPLEHWTIGLEAFGVALEHPADAYRGERGERVGLGFDLEWEEAGPIVEYVAPNGYGQPCRVQGDVLVGGDDPVQLEGWGHREHGWGPVDRMPRPRAWIAGRLDDGTSFAGWQAGDQGRGYVLEPADPAATLVPAPVVAADGGVDGLPLGGSARLGPLDLTLVPLALAPVPLDGGVRLPRALCRLRHGDGRGGVGWAEWCQAPG